MNDAHTRQRNQIRILSALVALELMAARRSALAAAPINRSTTSN